MSRLRVSLVRGLDTLAAVIIFVDFVTMELASTGDSIAAAVGDDMDVFWKSVVNVFVKKSSFAAFFIYLIE